MDYGFNSKEELYKRVLPVLNLKVREFKRMGITNITNLDIWNYLISKWKSGNNLMLNDIVNDILYSQAEDISSYLENNSLN